MAKCLVALSEIGKTAVIPELGIDPGARRKSSKCAIGVDEHDLGVVACDLGEAPVDDLRRMGEACGVIGIDQSGSRHRSCR